MLPLPNNLDGSFSELLRIGQAAHLLGVNANTLRNWERQGKISSIRIGRRGDRRYRQAELLALLSSSGGETSAPFTMPNQTSKSGAILLTPDELFESIGLKCISLSEAARLTGYAEDYLGQRARIGELKAIKIGRNWITHRSSLNDFCKTHPGAYPHRPKRFRRYKNSRKIKNKSVVFVPTENITTQVTT